MKITNKTPPPPPIPFPSIHSSKKPLKNLSPDSDLFPKPKKPHRPPPRWKPRSPAGGGVRFKRDRPQPAGKRSRPETPLLKWKFDERKRGEEVEEEEERPPPEFGRRREPAGGSSRKLAAVLWRLQLPEATLAVVSGGRCGGEEKSGRLKKEKDRSGFQVCIFWFQDLCFLGCLGCLLMSRKSCEAIFDFVFYLICVKLFD